MNKIYSRIVTVFVFTILLIGATAVRAALIDSVTVTPEFRTSNTPLTVNIAGVFPTTGYTITGVTSQRDAADNPYIIISLQTTYENVAQVLTPYSVSHDIGQFVEGNYPLTVSMVNQYGLTVATVSLDSTNSILVIGCTPPTENPLAPIVCNIPSFMPLTVLTSHTVNWKPVIEDPRTTGPITCHIDTPPLFGSATIASDCSTGTYTASSLANSEEFTYRAYNGVTESSPAMVSVSVNQNSAPKAFDVAAAGPQDTIIAWIPFVTDDEADIGHLRCRIVQQPANGTVTIAEDCSGGTYTPKPGFFGSDIGYYVASDGDLESTPAFISITVNRTPTACMLANPVRSITLGTGKGVEGTLSVSFTGHILSGTNKSVSICPDTTLGFTASASGERDYLVTCRVNDTLVNKIFGAVSGTVKTGDRLRCTNKEPPDDPDTTYYPGKDTDIFDIRN